MRKLLPSQFDPPETTGPKGQERPMQRAFLKIAGLDRVVTADAIDLIQGRPSDVRIQLSDGTALQVRKYDLAELVGLLSPHMASHFVAVRSRGVSGQTVYLNSDNLTGYSTTGARLVVYFGMNRPVLLDGGYAAADVQASLEAVCCAFVKIEPTPRAPALISHEVYDGSGYDIDRLNLPGRV